MSQRSLRAFILDAEPRGQEGTFLLGGCAIQALPPEQVSEGLNDCRVVLGTIPLDVMFSVLDQFTPVGSGHPIWSELGVLLYDTYQLGLNTVEVSATEVATLVSNKIDAAITKRGPICMLFALLGDSESGIRLHEQLKTALIAAFLGGADDAKRAVA